MKLIKRTGKRKHKPRCYLTNSSAKGNGSYTGRLGKKEMERAARRVAKRDAPMGA